MSQYGFSIVTRLADRLVRLRVEIGRRPQRDVDASGSIETNLAVACPECDPVHAEVEQMTLAVRHVGPARLHRVDPLSIGERTSTRRVRSGKTDAIVGDARPVGLAADPRCGSRR